MNRETGMTNAAGTAHGRNHHLVYDEAGQPDDVTNPARQTTTTTYDALDRDSTVEDADDGDHDLHLRQRRPVVYLTDPDQQYHDLCIRRDRRADRRSPRRR